MKTKTLSNKKLLKEICNAGYKESDLCEFERIIDTIDNNIPTMIGIEPYANRKTIITLVRLLASQLKTIIWPIECNENTTKFDLIGENVSQYNINEYNHYIKKESKFFFGPLLWHYVNGGTVVLNDAIQSLDFNTLKELGAFITMPSKYFCEATGKIYKRHPKFRIVLIESTRSYRWIKDCGCKVAIEDRLAFFKIDRIFIDHFLLEGETL